MNVYSNRKRLRDINNKLVVTIREGKGEQQDRV